VSTSPRAPIGIFDSGLGGLTVARAVFERLPHEGTIYFGDTARVPYGPKSPETVRRYSLEILYWLLDQGVKAVVVACNTSTAHALDALRAASPVPVVGVIDPGARAAVAAAGGRPVGVTGTAGTIASGAYERSIRALEPSAVVVSQACPLFVPLVEEGWFDHPAAELIAREYLAPVQAAGVGAVVLGCTHYPLLKPLIGRILGPGVALIDSAEAVAGAIARELAEAGLLAGGAEAGVHRFAVSDDPARFRAVGIRFLGDRLGSAELVTLETERAAVPSGSPSS
jgi:glutamate racemase